MMSARVLNFLEPATMFPLTGVKKSFPVSSMGRAVFAKQSIDSEVKKKKKKIKREEHKGAIHYLSQGGRGRACKRRSKKNVRCY